ncbi:hypothetical protein ACLGIH_07040 [Streptomyces sp. HMX87]|uniref:hypothetical protein n=1 Tax=Streptomyces sp. HMX87 TaxID=3390849 RepID=UPI003A869A58
MKHRGRHRRRRQGRALRAALAGAALALTGAATMISASQATVADDPGRLKPLTAPAERAPMRLTEHRVPQSWLDRLSSSMGRPLDVGAVLADADRTLRDADGCPAAEREALPVAPAATRAYCWDEADTRGWLPGAVAASGDGDGGSGVIVSAWSRESRGPAGRGLARVAFVDAGEPAPDPAAPDRPRHVSALLVVPVDGGQDYRGLASPVSGMVRHQDKLLVTAGAGDRSALYVYDLDRIQRTTVDADAMGRVPGGWAADGYEYVMPAVASYRLPGGTGVPGAARPHTLALDRSTTPAGLVAGEWVPADGDRPTRLWRYALSTDPARAGLPAVDARGHAQARRVYETGAAGVRGLLVHHPSGAEPDWYLARAADDGPDGRGTLVRQDTGGTRAAECGADRSQHCWTPGAGALAYRPETGEVWSQSGRVLFAVPLTSIDGSLG